MELDTLNYIIETYEDTIDRLITTGIGNKTEFKTFPIYLDILSYNMIPGLIFVD